VIDITYQFLEQRASSVKVVEALVPLYHFTQCLFIKDNKLLEINVSAAGNGTLVIQLAGSHFTTEINLLFMRVESFSDRLNRKSEET
jgi:hypothetical protein